ncbi:DNA-directed RNA polymerase II subunit J [Blastocystis sp. ATCC 50177/Nand II]|uniref:DNA-directed RNA polymerase II subunit J n=1 Tax=Blastocystis sp. subtype 1 (strain ATCC 50177 / NandII) TaxID=478820 RepID=A0A196SPX8_BLAHN|nr:DNA-directed RNA polymerase II subunit J [Blastocystis sp. ATCC 50177/Nand II]
MNAPDPDLAVHVEDGLSKVTQVVETKISNACKYIIEAEDHTLGNVLRMDMIEDPRVKFVGYRVPHPLKTSIEIKIQTNGPTYPPKKAMLDSCQRIMTICKEMDEDILNFEQRLSKDNDEHVF